LWQRIIEVKAGQNRRPQREAQRRAHEFSRIIVCASCRRALSADSYDHKTYYRDTSRIRKLPCSAFGSLHVRGSVVATQFGQLLAGVHHVLALGHSAQWERHGDEVRLRTGFIPPKLERSETTLQPDQRKLTASEREAARQLLAGGKSMRQVAAHFNVSRMAIWRIAETHPRRDGLREDKQQGGDA
jgi:hypothetical protein